MTHPWLTILGIGEDGVEGLSPAAAALLAAAPVVYGAARQLALAAPLIRGAARPWPSPMADGVAALLARRGEPALVLASGDPFCFGLGAVLARALPPGAFHCIPAPSAISLAAARLGWALQDCATISFCGRPLEPLRPLLQPGARILALSADAATPAALAALLVRLGFGPTRMQVLDALGGPRERRHACTAEAFDAAPDALNLVALEVVAGPRAQVLPLAAGLPEAWFEHDGQITKREVRAVTLAALAPRQGELLWDIGCGSGSVAIEWLLRHPANRAIGLEPRPDRAARAARNALALGVPGLRLVPAAAPEGLAGLPAPDAVFLGGGAAGPGVLDAAWAALRPGGRLVANAVTIETEAALLAAHGRWGGSLTRIGIERLDRVGRLHGWRPAMTVTQYAVEKPLPKELAEELPEELAEEPDAVAVSDPGAAAALPAVAGLGLRPAAEAADLVAVVRRAESLSGHRVVRLAVPDFRAALPAVAEAAARLGLPLVAVPRDALLAVQPRCPTRSEAALRAIGIASVAEGCALTQGGALLLPRIDGEGVSCALAALAADGEDAA